MSTLWKDAIIAFLNDKDEKALRATLRREWIDIYPEEKNQIYDFLYFSHQYKLFVYLFAIDLKSQIPDLPWLKALQIIQSLKLKMDSGYFEELLRNFSKLKLVGKSVHSLDELILEVRDKQRMAFLQKILKLKQELISSARIAQSEQLIDQHVHYMNELKKISPKEYNVSSLISEREKQRAQKIINRLNKRRQQRSVPRPQLLSDEELLLIERLEKQAQNFLESQSALATDFAYLFRTLGGSRQAIGFILQHPQEEKKDWQLLDYLFSGKQYLSLLEHCNKLKNKYSQYPNALFSISYAEAVAFWELGEKEKAIYLMGQISTMRPNFKLATETLAQWKEESFE